MIPVYETEPKPQTNGTAEHHDTISPGVPKTMFGGVPVEIVDEQVLMQASIFYQPARVLEKNPVVRAGFRYLGAIYLVGQLADNHSSLTMYLMAPRDTVRHKSSHYGEGFSVTYNGRAYALTTPLILMTKECWSKTKEGDRQ